MKRTHIVIHHTGAEERDASQIWRYHVRGLGWQDIGYNYVIERSGLVVVGRSLDIPGAHCRENNMNRVGIGIALIGNFEESYPNEMQLHSLYALCTQLCLLHIIEPDRIRGHSTYANTKCPGKNMDVSAVRRVVGRTYLPTLPEVRRV